MNGTYFGHVFNRRLPANSIILSVDSRKLWVISFKLLLVATRLFPWFCKQYLVNFSLLLTNTDLLLILSEFFKYLYKKLKQTGLNVVHLAATRVN